MAILLPCLPLCHAQSDPRQFDGLVWLACITSRVSAESAESGERRNKAAAAAGSQLIGGRGRALLCSRVELGFVKQRLEEL